MTRRGEVAAKYAHSAANARVAEEARVADHAQCAASLSRSQSRV